MFKFLRMWNTSILNCFINKKKLVNIQRDKKYDIPSEGLSNPASLTARRSSSLSKKSLKLDKNKAFDVYAPVFLNYFWSKIYFSSKLFCRIYELLVIAFDFGLFFFIIRLVVRYVFFLLSHRKYKFIKNYLFLLKDKEKINKKIS